MQPKLSFQFLLDSKGEDGSGFRRQPGSFDKRYYGINIAFASQRILSLSACSDFLFVSISETKISVAR